MIVCVCEGISHKTIERCVDEGARTLGEVARRCGAGTRCGTCHDDIRELVRHFRAQREERPGQLAAK